MYEYEFEAPAQQEWEDEGEWEGEGEYEDEADRFFSKLAGLARQAVTNPALKQIGLSAARSALRGLGTAGSEFIKTIGGDQAPGLAAQLGAMAGSRLNSKLAQQEWELEDEDEWTGEVNPTEKVYPRALMEHLGHAACQAKSEAEAEAFVGALVPLAAQMIPKAASAIMKTAPGLVSGLANAARSLRSSPTTRPLVRTLPTVMQRTAASLAQQSASGKPITPQSAVRTLARQTANVVGNPQQATQAYQRSRTMDQRYHRQQKAAQEMMF